MKQMMHTLRNLKVIKRFIGEDAQMHLRGSLRYQDWLETKTQK